jgi:hypothetical protein
MGTWGAGPFANDAALDFVGGITDQLVEAVESFVRVPRIDEGFDEAFAAVAVLNLIAAGSNAHRPEPAVVRQWRDAMLKCFDEQIEELAPAGGFADEQRSKVVEQLDRLIANAEAFHNPKKM